MMRDDQIKESAQNADDEYMGNMWGWKFSLLGLALIVLLTSLLLVRQCQVEAETGEKVDLFEMTNE